MPEKKRTTFIHFSPLKQWQRLAFLTSLYVLFLLFRWVFPISAFRPSSPLLSELFFLFELGMLLLLGILWGLWIWTRSTTSTTKGSYSSEQMNIQFTPAGFETYVAELFRERGYEAQLRGGAGDMGVDVELYKWTGERAIVQCKKYKRLVGPEVVRELYGTLQHEQASHAFLVTTARISKSAREWAKGKPITLIDGDRLSELASDLGFPPFEG